MRKRKPYNTWKEIGGNRFYQIDHMTTEESNKKYVTDCGAKCMLIDSDHKAIYTVW